MTQGALTRIRLIEIGVSLIWRGRFCGQLMGDHGAEVDQDRAPKVGRCDAQLGGRQPALVLVVGRQ